MGVCGLFLVVNHPLMCMRASEVMNLLVMCMDMSDLNRTIHHNKKQPNKKQREISSTWSLLDNDRNWQQNGQNGSVWGRALAGGV